MISFPVIQGVTTRRLSLIPDERGFLMEALRSDWSEFIKFGQAYITACYPAMIKAWHYHKKQWDNFVCVQGMIKLVLYDDRNKSVTKGRLIELFIGDHNYCLVKIPAGVWNGFKCVSRKQALVANCATIPHRPGEIARMDPFTKKIPYNWELKHG